MHCSPERATIVHRFSDVSTFSGFREESIEPIGALIGWLAVKTAAGRESKKIESP